MKILNIISILLMVILLSNCDRKNKEPLYCLMQQEFKDYIAFAPGSYWVYKNSLGGKDSVVLTNQEIIKVEEDFNHNISEELHQIFIINNTDTIYMYSGLYSFPNCIYI